MYSCTFFGNRYCEETVKEPLKIAVKSLIKQSYDTFYVGNHGKFDSLVLEVLQEIKAENYHFSFFVVLAYLPRNDFHEKNVQYDTIYPEGLENVPPRFAINKRNLWMLKKSDAVITHVVDTTGNSQKYRELAKKQGKLVIDV